MKAFRARKRGAIDVLALDDVPDPRPAAGEIVIAVQAAGVNLADIAAVAGARQPAPSFPFVPGMEVAGRVEAVGRGVKGLGVGDRVVAAITHGGLAQQVVAPAGACVALPKKLEFGAAACLPVAYGGALSALSVRAGLKRGETLLVLGAGGTMGLAAIAVGKVLGAAVIASAGGKVRGTPAEEAGAAHVVDASSVALGQAVMDLTGGKGADVIFDPVGGDAFAAALQAAARNARIVSVGFAGGRMPNVNLGALFARNATLHAANFSFALADEPRHVKAMLSQIVEWVGDRRITPRIAAQFALKDAKHAFDYVRSGRANGNVIVTMDV